MDRRGPVGWHSLSEGTALMSVALLSGGSDH